LNQGFGIDSCDTSLDGQPLHNIYQQPSIIISQNRASNCRRQSISGIHANHAITRPTDCNDLDIAQNAVSDDTRITDKTVRSVCDSTETLAVTDVVLRAVTGHIQLNAVAHFESHRAVIVYSLKVRSTKAIRAVLVIYCCNDHLPLLGTARTTAAATTTGSSRRSIEYNTDLRNCCTSFTQAETVFVEGEVVIG
jgi:hypothetical protein